MKIEDLMIGAGIIARDGQFRLAIYNPRRPGDGFINVTLLPQTAWALSSRLGIPITADGDDTIKLTLEDA